MSQAVSDVVIGVSADSGSSNAAAAPFDLNAGFLGTGASSMVEVSYIVMLLIVGYIAYGTFRYFMPDVRITSKIMTALGLD